MRMGHGGAMMRNNWDDMTNHLLFYEHCENIMLHVCYYM
jgi:hypothetical protein